MATIAIRRVSAMPVTPLASTIYLVEGAGANDLDIFVTNIDATVTRTTPTRAEIASLISSQVASISDNATLYADIATRDAATPTANQLALVVDATADANVDAGAATYIYDQANTTWIKISEAESLDVSVAYSDLTGAPSSSTADIDDAVAKKHDHANKAVIDGITESVGGLLTYAGHELGTVPLAEEAW